MFSYFCQGTFKTFKQILLGLIIIVLVPMPDYSQTISFFETGEEFVGPFPSWKNIKTDYGAKGDGVTDDAAAIRTAVAAMKSPGSNSWCVLYFPAGTYKINSTINNPGRSGDEYTGMKIIGEDPATTVFVWGGSSGAMWSIDGWDIKVSRITFDGKSSASSGILRNGVFGTFTEISDVVFKDMRNGIDLGGSSDMGQAEHTIIRCQFYRITGNGISMNNWNSLDIWVWWCYFEDCASGIYNGAGGFQAYENVFMRSTVRDINMSNSCWASIVNNKSFNSKSFNSVGLHVQGNQIYTNAATSMSGDVLIDNIVRRSSAGVGPVISATGYKTLVGNTFANITNPFSVSSTMINIGQKIVDPTTIPVPATVQLPGTPKNKNRTIFEVRPGNAADIQTQIIAACADAAGPKAVVHIPKGDYSIASTIVIPGNKNIQLVGDGGTYVGSMLRWSGATTATSGPVLRLRGPSRVTLRDIGITGGANNGSAYATGVGAIIIEGADQTGGRIYGQSLIYGLPNGSYSGEAGFFIDSVENSDVSLFCSDAARAGVGLKVRGGAVLKSGGKTPGQVTALCGCYGPRMADVLDGGRVVLEAMWIEGAASVPLIDLTSASSGSITTTTQWTHLNISQPFYRFNNFKGRFTSLCDVYGSNGQTQWNYWEISGDGSNSNILACNDNFDMYSGQSFSWNQLWRDNSSPAAKAAAYNCTANRDPMYNRIPNIMSKGANVTPDTQFVLQQLEQLRAVRIEPPNDRAVNVTDVKMFRCYITSAANRIAVHVKAGPLVGVNRLLPGKSKMSAVNNTIKVMPLQGASVRLPGNITSVSVYDLQGKNMYNKNLYGSKDVLDAGKQIEKINRSNAIVVKMRLE